MDFIFSPVCDASSVFVKTTQSIICCIIHFKQKTESEEPLIVTFKDSPMPGQEEIIKSTIEKVLLNTCPVTQIHVEYIELIKGRDCISCYINGFSIAAKLGKIEVTDTLCAATFSTGGIDCFNGNISYLLNKGEVINFHVMGKIDNADDYYLTGIEECKKNARNFMSRLKEFKATGKNRE